MHEKRVISYELPAGPWEMDEPRLIDGIRDQAFAVMVERGIEETAAKEIAIRLARSISEEWGGASHYVHAVPAIERAMMLASDPRPVAEVAKEYGVNRVTVYRARRRVIFGGIK